MSVVARTEVIFLVFSLRALLSIIFWWIFKALKTNNSTRVEIKSCHFRVCFLLTFRPFPFPDCGGKTPQLHILPSQQENITRWSFSTDEIIPGFSALTKRFVDKNSGTSFLNLPLFSFKLLLTFSPSTSSCFIPFFHSPYKSSPGVCRWYCLKFL